MRASSPGAVSGARRREGRAHLNRLLRRTLLVLLQSCLWRRASSLFSFFFFFLRGKTFNVGDLVTIEFLARNIASSAELWKRKMLRNNANTIDTASRWALNFNALGSQTRGEPSSRGEKRKIPLVRDFGAREISPGGQN